MAFGPFVVLPSSRTLLRDGRTVCLGARAFDLLLVLLSSPGKVVSKEEIVQHVWPTTTVDESNLRFQMGCLRKALSHHRDIIKTIPGRGYFLVAEIQADVSVSALELMPFTPEQRAICTAISGLLDAFNRYPEALTSVETLLSRGIAFEVEKVPTQVWLDHAREHASQTF